MTHEQYKEMLAVAALAAREGDPFAFAPADLDDDYTQAERDALDAHLATCAECRSELAVLRDTTAMLSYIVADASASAEVREKVLSRARGEKGDEIFFRSTSIERAETASGANVVPLVAGRPRPIVEAGETEAKGAVIPHPRASAGAKSPFGWFWKFGMLAACIALVAFGVAIYGLWQRNETLTRQLADLNNERQQMSDELKSARADLAILTAPDARTMQLTGTGVAPQAQARLAYETRTGRAVLYASNLPPAPAGKAYQIWYIANGRPLPGKVFNTDARGDAVMHDQIPPDGRNAALVAVTLEPATGMQSPTGEKYLLSSSS